MDVITTGSTALDSIVGGGLPAGSLIVIAGAPGTGKTILAQQICFANATPDRRALYLTTWSEPHDKLVRHLAPFDFFDREALGERVAFLHLSDIAAGDAGLAAVGDEIVRQAFESRPAVVVVDSSKSLHDVASPDRFRRFVYDLASKVAHSNAVLILVGEYTGPEMRTDPEFAVADGILQLENEAHGPTDRRWLRVLKMRGAAVAPGQHSFRIGSQGFEVFRRLETTLPALVPAVAGRASLGVEGLDARTGGGLPRGDSALVVGPAGVGKTMLALQFVAAGVQAGERCLFVSFQETEAQLREKGRQIGLDLSGDRVVFRHIAPVELDLDLAAAHVRGELERGPVERVVVDSLSELDFAARDTERFPAYIWALAGFVRAAGGTTLFTNELASLGADESLGGLSFLFDDVLFLRYVEAESELRRGFNALKMRRSAHESGMVEFAIGPEGIEVRGRFDGLTGMLGWTALRGE
jgi:circadian clock protein KaiC